MSNSRSAANSGLNALAGWRSLHGNGPLPVASADIPGHPVRGVVVDVDGSYSVVFEDGPDTPVALALKAGVQYAFFIRRLTAAAGSMYGGGS